MGGEIGIIGGADTPTFLFILEKFLLNAVIAVLIAIAIASAAMLCILFLKKRKKHDENKKDRRKR